MSELRIPFSLFERKALTLHLVTRTKPENRKQRRLLEDLFTQLGVEDLEAELLKTGLLLPDPENDATQAGFTVDVDALDYLCASFNVEIVGNHARTILKIENRILSAKDPKYVYPEDVLMWSGNDAR